MKRLLRWGSFLLLLFAIAMNMAHIGSIWLWTGVIVVAMASLLYISTREQRAAGRR